MKNTPGILISILVFLSFLFLSVVPAHTFFATDGVYTDPELSGELSQVIRDHWFKRKDKILTGEDLLGNRELEEIYQVQLDQGIRNIPILSRLLLRESLRALSRNGLDEAEFLCAYAKKYAPDFPSPYFAMGRIYWTRSKTMIAMVLREYVNGVYAVFKNFRILFFKSLNLAYWLSGAMLLTFLVFSVITGLKYVYVYVYDVRKTLDLTPGKLATGLLKVFAFVVPVLLQVNILWVLLYWTILMWGYLARRERRMIVFFLFVLVYVPWMLERSACFLETSDTAISLTLHEANYESWDEDTASLLREWNRERPGDSDILFTLGLLSKREGQYGEAERHYRGALQIEQEWPECISNLANVYLITNRLDEAIELYQRAISLSRRKGAFWFNLHRAFARESFLESEKVGKALQKASELDSGLVAFHTKIYSENENRSVIDDPIGVGRLWKKVIKLFQSRYLRAQGLLSAWTGSVSRVYDFVWPAFFLLFLVVFSVVCSKRNFRKPCPMCGTPSIKFFARRIHGDVVCFGCNRLFLKKDSVDPKMKEKRLRQVERYGGRKVIVRTVLSLVVPGGGHLWKDQAIKGSVFIFIFFALGLKFFHWNGIVHDPVSPGGSPGFWTQIIFVVVFVLYYLGVLKSSFRIES